MPYKPTGKPPGRPRKVKPGEVQTEPVKTLSRAREGFRRAFADPADGLHHPPRRGKRSEIGKGKRPMLHPNVIYRPQ
jgi:hypothetical protein